MNRISNTLIIVMLLFVNTTMAQKENKMKNLNIEKTVQIKADIQTVYDHIVYLKNFPKWSPFLEADPSQKIEVKGKDGEIGAQYHWEGNKGKDLGYQEIVSITPQKAVLMQCEIQKPFKARPTFHYKLKQEGEYVVVTQDFNLSVKSLDLFFMKLFGAVKDINKVNERGLQLLKIVCEK